MARLCTPREAPACGSAAAIAVLDVAVSPEAAARGGTRVAYLHSATGCQTKPDPAQRRKRLEEGQDSRRAHTATDIRVAGDDRFDCRRGPARFPEQPVNVGSAAPAAERAFSRTVSPCTSSRKSAVAAGLRPVAPNTLLVLTITNWRHLCCISAARTPAEECDERRYDVS